MKRELDQILQQYQPKRNDEYRKERIRNHQQYEYDQQQKATAMSKFLKHQVEAIRTKIKEIETGNSRSPSTMQKLRQYRFDLDVIFCGAFHLLQFLT